MWKVVIVQGCSLCVIHSSDEHGQTSLGWESSTKIVIWEHLDHDDESLELYSGKEAYEEGIISKDQIKDWNKERKRLKAYQKEMFEFFKPIAQIIADKLNEKYPKQLPEFYSELV